MVAGARLHLVGPLGFDIDDHKLKRAGLAYWESLDVTVYRDWADFLERCGLDYLVFGKESAGLPEGLLAELAERCERIPMLPDASALDNREEWAARADELGGGASTLEHTALMRRDICGNFVDPDDWRISALNLANAASIVLYEALRQNGFPGMDA